MTAPAETGSILLYQTADGQSKIEVRLCNDTVWLTADQIAELFQRNKSTISRHIKNVFDSGELQASSTVAFFATVQNEGNRKVERNIAFYNLDMIISVGYRVNSYRGVQFRLWATQVLREYLVKGFAMNDDLLKRAGGGNYFDELLSRIRDIRSSEKFFIGKSWKSMRSASTMTPGPKQACSFLNPNRSLDFGEIARLCHAACFSPSRRRSGLRRGVARSRMRTEAGKMPESLIFLTENSPGVSNDRFGLKQYRIKCTFPPTGTQPQKSSMSVPMLKKRTFDPCRQDFRRNSQTKSGYGI